MAAVLLLVAVTPSAMAQFQQGGVDHPGEWYVGEGLQAGDFFSYSMCHVDYRECANFQMDIWIKGDIVVGTETKWLAHVVVYDGNKIIKGEMELGRVAPEPSGGSEDLTSYRGAFKSSVVWLSAFANSNEPKAFSLPSWGKIANIGGEQILPRELIDGGFSTAAGHFDDVVQVGWRTGGYTSKVWVADGFPFPVQALTWTHVSEGIPPREYEFELLRYYNTDVDPLADVVPTSQDPAIVGCPNLGGLEQSIKKSTILFNYQVHAFYTPDPPVENCPMKWLVKFISKYDDTEFLNQVQYDIQVVELNEEGQLVTTRSIADEIGRRILYSPSGQSEIEFMVKESGTVNYMIFIHGLAPENVVPSQDQIDYLLLPLDISSAEDASIPPWVKNTALWWAQGDIDDDSFINGLQFLIGQGILNVPPPDSVVDGAPGPIPSWVKNNALWWAQGDIDDDSFINGLQFLIGQGILQVS